MNLEQSNPLVTVYIPTFNRVELLKRAVDSVRKQTYKNLEIIIVDDCSKDGTHEYLEEIIKQDSRIRYFIKEQNSGACVSRNIAIDNASGEYITGLDDDDYFTENRIELFIKFWNPKDSNLVGMCTPVFTNNLNNKRFLAKFFYILSVKNIKKRDLYFANYVGNQVFTKTVLLRKLGGFDKSLRAWQDLDMWFRLLDLGTIKKNEKPTYFVDRSHEMGRITTNNISKIIEVKKYFINKHNITEKIFLHGLNNHLIHYDPKKVSFLDLLVKMIFNFDLIGNIKYFFFYLKKKYNKG